MYWTGSVLQGYCNAAQALDEVGLLDDRDHPRLQPTLSPVRWV
jgi:phosphoribosylformylglycinamidine (FGAM) synthase-like amidotransferase family enzyme